MSIDITMPKLTDTMEEGTIVRWLKQIGERVSAGEILAEVETDKADMELEAPSDGVLREIKVGEGDAAPVGAVIAVLAAAAQATSGTRTETPKPAAAPKASAPTESTLVAPAATPVKSASRLPAATPLARRVAQQANVELGEVTGSGQRGRVTKRDIGIVTPAASVARTPTSVAPPAAGRVELSKMRQTIAHRMADAMREIPHFYTTAEVDMGDAVRLRASLELSGVVSQPVTVTHILIKAVALALRRHPRVNAAWADGAVLFNEAINIGIATAVEDGLLVPVLKNCERLSLVEIAAAARSLNDKARGGRFVSDEMLGGTFTISNMGMLDIDEFTAIINPPQAAILAVGAIKERAVVRSGRLAVAQTMRVTLSCDHRILNGVESARFLEELKRLLENPVALVMA
ncbi:MAG TPA: dihydrolipoamide acetyltransferase family protein [Candidatus Kryptonia bacterium]|nr:dihydrolipoamide acetyltransferase family protein [Candidatus Kryptonia bacterium]